MQPPVMTKFGFRIRTRQGLAVDNLVIQGRDEVDAERKLRQMYHGCEVVECMPMSGSARSVPPSFEDVVRLITAC